MRSICETNVIIRSRCALIFLQIICSTKFEHALCDYEEVECLLCCRPDHASPECHVIRVDSLPYSYIRRVVITYIAKCGSTKKALNPARGQLNAENEYFPVPVRA